MDKKLPFVVVHGGTMWHGLARLDMETGVQGEDRASSWQDGWCQGRAPGVRSRCCKEGAWHRGRGVARGLVTREQDEGAQVGGGSPEHHDLPNGSLARHPRSF